MNFSRKLHKAFRLDFLQSGYEHLRRRIHPVDTAAILAKLDGTAWAELNRRYRDPALLAEASARNSFKFADAKYWIPVNVERAQDLSLNRAKPMRILDLGCGAGYFLFVAQCLGHEAVGLDLDENPLYRETVKMLGVQRHVARIDPLQPLPELGRFDLITAHCICFQKISPLADERWVQWGIEEWDFFLRDVRSRLLKPEGLLLLDFNPRRGEPFYTAEVAEFFRASGGRIFRSKVYLNAAEPVSAQQSPSSTRQLALSELSN